ncbi:serine hydrolase [Aerosticca soli]|uniref:Beta-lactamase n=1 Tax=Aerosticca soli TaxID=2010829 RepID=A0A2Z6E803_9GAMM|nr:serine hydrolase [Aerosticca soli]MDI3262244.1 serine hydrolase [Fulvimonas sp.]BBD80922.1 beta-lactamase [Aerosticca soli]
MHAPMPPRRYHHAVACIAAVAATLVGASSPAAAQPETTLTSEQQAYLDRQVDETFARYHLPGLAVGVIVDGKVAYVRTLGERVAGSGEKIDADTLFKIASNSKAMTTALLGRLVDQGKLRWDDKVTQYLPDFRMYDPWVTREMQVGDLLTHSSGLREGAGDLMLWPEPNDFTRADIIHALRYLKPAYGFRSQYQYDNLLYVVAGELAAAAGGAPYDVLMRREVFAPLGLARCQVGAWQRDEVGNVAQPHGWIDGRNQPIRIDGAQIPASAGDPAGGIRCSLNDLLAWTMNWLAPTPAQLQWLTPAQRVVLQSPHMPIPLPALRRQWDHSHVMAYGYGWRMADVDGQWTVWHTGTLAGMYSELMLLPDRRGGFVLLINGNGGAARTVLGEALLKFFTDPADTRGVAGYAALLDEAAAAKGARSDTALPDSATLPPANPERMAGRLGVYRDPWFGTVSVCAQDGTVHFRADKSPRLAGLVVEDHGRYLVRWDDRSIDPDAWLDFHAAAPMRLTLAKRDPHGDVSADYEDLDLTRVGACPASITSSPSTGASPPPHARFTSLQAPLAHARDASVLR